MTEVIFYMASSLNGLICRSNDKTNFVSDDEWQKGFIPIVREIKCMIVGKTTYEVMRESNEFDHFENDLYVVVVTSDQKYSTDMEKHLVAHSPENALKIVATNGFEKTLISGGTILNSSFLEKNLVDRVIVDIEPILVADGKQLFKAKDTDIHLELEDIKKLTKNLIQLNYKVKK